MLSALPVAVYTTDAEGNITFYNEAAAALWGCRPELGSSRWCGSWKLFWPDGQPMPHEECPMAVCLREGREIRGARAIAERPDGTRVPFTPYPTPLKDADGRVVGAINLLVDASDEGRRESESSRLAAIVEGSQDAIISKTLDGIITTWNAGAERIFGYSAEEMIGTPIIRIVPKELRDEERDILAKLRRGERLQHFDTVRVGKDGRRVHVSISVSPVRDGFGNIVGASKVARDVTDRKQSEDLQKLLIEELNHRVKNTLATIQAIAGQSLRLAASPGAFVTSFNGRVQALARAHDLLVQGQMRGASMKEMVREQVLVEGDPRATTSGPAVTLSARAAVQIALVLHELATNARKYGALSVPQGRLSIAWHLIATPTRELMLVWKESGVQGVRAPSSRGFGSQLIQRTMEANGGEASMRYDIHGLSCEIRLPLPEEDQPQHTAQAHPARPRKTSPVAGDDVFTMNGKRILLIEDEALVAMELEAELMGVGCEVVGPAGNIAAARRYIAEERIDAALVDANLAGSPVDELAAALVKRGIPFAFATGYGRDGLPREFQDARVLTKPFSKEQMLAVVQELLDPPSDDASNVVQLR